MDQEIDNNKIVEDAFAELERLVYDRCSEEERASIRKAFELADGAHKGVLRKSGEPYILHPIAVAKIVVQDIGLSYKSCVSALLHDVVEDTHYTIEDIRVLFGDKIASIVDGLTKIEGVFDGDTSLQAENFKRILHTLTDDLRVILIKMADRLHNMRTIDSMPERKRAKIVGETMYFFVPLAHRLGLYDIKTELENLCLKNSLPDEYNAIQRKLDEGEEARQEFIQRFLQPIRDKFEQENVNVKVIGHTRSVYSVWHKMNSKKLAFEEITNLFTVRVVFESQLDITERAQCWNIYQLLTEVYRSRLEQLRDWTNTPKVNGYEALHCTVVGPLGTWVEVQVRSRRMDEIASHGVVAYWKYKKGTDQENELDKWLQEVKDVFDHPEEDQSTMDFLDRFQSGLLAFEVYVYTPKGDAKAMPKGATALDFAYSLHTVIGNKAIAAKVNHKLQPLNYTLRNGDQIEILTAEAQHPQPEWIDMVVTPKAKSHIMEAMKAEQHGHYKQGHDVLEEELKKLGITIHSRVLNKLMLAYKVSNKHELMSKIGAGVINLSGLEDILRQNTAKKQVRYWGLQFLPSFGAKKEAESTEKIDKKATYELKEETEGKSKLSYKAAPCCRPIPGDDIICFMDDDDKGVTIHTKKCREALRMAAQNGERIIQARWAKHKAMSFLVRLEMRGIDRIGVLQDLSNLITGELSVNIRRIFMSAHDGIFESYLDLYVHDTNDLEILVDKVKGIKGMESVKRVDKVDD